MSYPVTYYCPHCGTLVDLDRDGYLADKSVTPYPLEGWTYVTPTEPFDGADDDGAADGTRPPTASGSSAARATASMGSARRRPRHRRRRRRAVPRAGSRGGRLR